MTDLSWTSGPPKKILLATDLSARCDRALDRAAGLAGQWQSSLIVLHVLEEFDAFAKETAQLPSWWWPAEPVSVAERYLLADIRAAGAEATVLVEKGNPVDTILRIAEAEQCGLIVAGLARDELLGRFSLGGTVDRLLRRARSPLLIVKDRPRRPYRHIVVATDFSDSSCHALQAATRFFPDQRLTLFHAYDAPASELMEDPTPYLREYRKVIVQKCEEFLDQVEKPVTWQAPHLLIEQGSPTALLRDYVRQKEVDLVVLGTHGRSAILEVFIGSVAKAIMDEIPCDALIVREPRAAVDA